MYQIQFQKTDIGYFLKVVKVQLDCETPYKKVSEDIYSNYKESISISSLGKIISSINEDIFEAKDSKELEKKTIKDRGKEVISHYYQSFKKRLL